MEINLECRNCRCIFDCDVGAVTFPKASDRPCFEKQIICPRCGERSMDEVFLTELGQSQLTRATLDSSGDDLFGSEDDDSSDFGSCEAECQGCDIFQRVNDLWLCEGCAAKLERDLIRQRSWDHTISGFAASPAEREEIRKEVTRRTVKSSN